MDFLTVDDKKLYVANKRLGVDKGMTIVEGLLTIDENEGPSAGNTYDVILRVRKGKKEVELARTRVTLR
jgi:hypothetical protein